MSLYFKKVYQISINFSNKEDILSFLNMDIICFQSYSFSAAKKLKIKFLIQLELAKRSNKLIISKFKIIKILK